MGRRCHAFGPRRSQRQRGTAAAPPIRPGGCRTASRKAPITTRCAAMRRAPPRISSTRPPPCAGAIGRAARNRQARPAASRAAEERHQVRQQGCRRPERSAKPPASASSRPPGDAQARRGGCGWRTGARPWPRAPAEGGNRSPAAGPEAGPARASTQNGDARQPAIPIKTAAVQPGSQRRGKPAASVIAVIAGRAKRQRARVTMEKQRNRRGEAIIRPNPAPETA